jgi:hypothetical protein
MKSILYFTFILTSLALQAQKTEKTAVMKTVNQLFHALETNDGKLAGSLFTSNARLYTIVPDDISGFKITNIPAEALAKAFDQPKDEIWSEPIWNEKIEIADGLATVWVDYAFYRGNEFSHCGVDAFQLVKLNGDWKIFHVADTRKNENCKVPKRITKRYQ